MNGVTYNENKISCVNKNIGSINIKSMKIYKIKCEWEMPKAKGTFKTREKAQEAIDNEEWENYTDYTLQEVQEDEMVSIVEINVK
ncbi:MAG: hypothetical protein ACJA2M_000340 [Polaribacter sp.]